ncbi:MT-A70 family methyltransferase [Orbus wheelerorum]|uniref:MT-A70 family methyltransferase n=1 Tax=Orbus wheelerorum TaxID=3074111 RepID=UPI00370D1B4C
MNKYSLIYCDPPWQYSNQATRAATNNHYPTMSLQEIKQLPISEISDKNSILAMWYTAAFSDEAKAVAEAWGYKVKTMKLFTWVKMNKCYKDNIDKQLNKNHVTCADDVLSLVFGQTKFGLGNYTRANSEDCLIAVKGKGLERLDKSISQVIYAPISKHSEKPQEARIRLERLYGNVPRIELFARGNIDNWDAWGNECRNSVELERGKNEDTEKCDGK